MADNLTSQVETLEAHCEAGALSVGDERFARSLISKAHLPSFSFKQRRWVGILIERATAPRTNEMDVGDMSDLYAFFMNARDHLKFPKLTIRLPDDTAVKLYMSTQRSKSPDTINVVLPDVYLPNGRNVWLGRIHQNGKWEMPHVLPECTSLVVDLVGALQQDAHGVAHAYGKHTGNCCFCLKTLSDARSVAVGYGKTCASNYGLSDQWKNAPVADRRVS